MQAPADIPTAVRRCCHAYTRSLAAERAKGSDHFDSHEAASAAYLTAMPFLAERDDIRAFIACVTHGMILGVLTTPRGTKLLYAAQVALGAIPREPRPVGRPPKSSSPAETKSVPPSAGCTASAAVGDQGGTSACEPAASPQKNTPSPSPERSAAVPVSGSSPISPNGASSPVQPVRPSSAFGDQGANSSPQTSSVSEKISPPPPSIAPSCTAAHSGSGI